MKKRSKSAPLATKTLLRISMLIFWAMLGVEIFGIPGPHRGMLLPIPRLVAVIGFLGFGLSVWLNTRNIARPSTNWLPAMLLIFQSVCGFVLNTDLLYIVAAEIPLVLPPRQAVIWICFHTLALTLWIFWLDQSGAPLKFLPLPNMPHVAVVLITDALVFAIHGFAFLMGYLAASEAHGRRAAEHLNAELMATRELLAQNSRIAERGYIAQELHDTLGHHLVALKLNLDLAQRLIEGKAIAPLSDATLLVNGLLSSVREVVSSVKNQPIIDLRHAIDLLLVGVTDLTVQLDFPDDLKIDDPAHAHALFRCVQEGVTNVIKHARSQRLWLEFRHDEHQITLSVRDDGQGAARVLPGYGLNGMRERLEAIGGTLDIHAGVGQGFTLMAWVPKTGGNQ